MRKRLFAVYRAAPKAELDGAFAVDVVAHIDGGIVSALYSSGKSKYIFRTVDARGGVRVSITADGSTGNEFPKIVPVVRKPYKACNQHARIFRVFLVAEKLAVKVDMSAVAAVGRGYILQSGAKSIKLRGAHPCVKRQRLADYFRTGYRAIVLGVEKRAGRVRVALLIYALPYAFRGLVGYGGCLALPAHVTVFSASVRVKELRVTAPCVITIHRAQLFIKAPVVRIVDVAALGAKILIRGMEAACKRISRGAVAGRQRAYNAGADGAIFNLVTVGVGVVHGECISPGEPVGVIIHTTRAADYILRRVEFYKRHNCAFCDFNEFHVISSVSKLFFSTVSRDASRRFGLSPASHHQAGLCKSSKSAVPTCYTARCCFICFLKCFMYCFVFGRGRYRERLVFSSVIVACKIKSVLRGFHLFILLCAFSFSLIGQAHCTLRPALPAFCPAATVRETCYLYQLSALLQALLDI